MAIDFASQTVFDADSLGGTQPGLLKRACVVLDIISRTLREKHFDFTGWALGSLCVCSPQQPNSSTVASSLS